MKREVITTEKAPAAIGPYSQAVKVGGFVYAAGQGGLDPASGQLVEGGVEAQAEQALKNLQAIFEAAGTGLENAVKTTIFLRYIKDFQAVNEVYAGFFGKHKPARSTVAVSALPMEALVEIEMVAFAPPDEEEEAAEEAKMEAAEPGDKPKKKDKKKKKKDKKKGKKKDKKKDKKQQSPQPAE